MRITSKLVLSCLFCFVPLLLSGCEPKGKDNTMDIVVRIFEHNIKSLRTIASDQVNGLAKNTDMITALKEGNREKIQLVVADFKSLQKCDFFTILDADGIVLFRTTNPDQFGDSHAFLRGFGDAVVTKKSSVYFETTASLPLYLCAAAPVLDGDGTVIAVITGGFRFDTNDWVDQVKQLYDVECTVFVDDVRVATTIKKPGTDERVVGIRLNNQMVYDTVFGKKITFMGEAVVVGQQIKVIYIPVVNEGDDKVMGMFFVAMP